MEQLHQRDERRVEFVERLAAATLKNIAADPFLANILKTTDVIETKKEGAQGEWRSYHDCCTLDGKVVVDEVVRLKGCAMRTNKKLLPGHTVPYPEYLELNWAKDVWSNMKATIDTTKLTEENREATADDRATIAATNRTFNQSFTSPASSGPRPLAYEAIADAPPATLTKLEQCEKDRKRAEDVDKCMKNLLRAHNEWDRRVRDFNTTIAKSKCNENTRDTPVERAVEGFIKDGSDVDDEIQKVLLKMKVSGELSSIECVDANVKCDEIVKIVKECAKKSVSLHTFMKA